MRRAQLCVTVTANTMAELCARRDNVGDADLVELRLDSTRDPDAAAALAGRRKPVIVTCRPSWEGGWFTGSEEERLRILREALDLGAEYVDLEFNAAFAGVLEQTSGRRIIISRHDFEGMPADGVALARAMRATGAEVVKIAGTAHRLTDCVRLRELASAAGEPSVLIAMGEAGIATRVLPERFGSRWTYAGAGVAPGQITQQRICEEFGFRRITRDAVLYGVIGRPVSHSLSPAMHNAAFCAAGHNAVYLPLAASDYSDFLAFADAIDVAGASVTAPFKVDAFERADERDEVSQRMRSSNTLGREGARWVARNTDAEGFLAPLGTAMRSLPTRGARATVLGAGGAARTVATALSSIGMRVTLCARRAAQARDVAAFTGASVEPWPPAPGSWDLLVNATPVGTAPRVDDSPLPDDFSFDGRLVYDLVYNPPRTRLLRDAARAGCATLGGLEMLVAQAQAQLEWWTGQRPDADVMRAAALNRLEAMEHR
ncbi:MAG: type I 3-dehydroquinate dehydratase [Vicinamibacterales bacterium]